jgi:hypothetical protein
VLREGLFDRLGQIVGGGAGGFKLNQECEHLLAQRVFDQRRLMGPVRTEDFAEPFGLGFDAAFAAGPLERGLERSAGEPCSPGRCRRRLDELVSLGSAQAVTDPVRRRHRNPALQQPAAAATALGGLLRTNQVRRVAGWDGWPGALSPHRGHDHQPGGG